MRGELCTARGSLLASGQNKHLIEYFESWSAQNPPVLCNATTLSQRSHPTPCGPFNHRSPTAHSSARTGGTGPLYWGYAKARGASTTKRVATSDKTLGARVSPHACSTHTQLAAGRQPCPPHAFARLAILPNMHIRVSNPTATFHTQAHTQHPLVRTTALPRSSCVGVLVLHTLFTSSTHVSRSAAHDARLKGAMRVIPKNFIRIRHLLGVLPTSNALIVP